MAHGRAGFEVRVEREGKPPLVAQWGGISLAWSIDTTLDDRFVPFRFANTTEIVQRLLAETCELCGSRDRIQVHHIRALKDLKRKGRPDKPLWVTVMAARRRKTLVALSSMPRGYPRWPPAVASLRDTGEPDDAKVSRPVRRGADGKGPQVHLSGRTMEPRQSPTLHHLGLPARGRLPAPARGGVDSGRVDDIARRASARPSTRTPPTIAPCSCGPRPRSSARRVTRCSRRSCSDSICRRSRPPRRTRWRSSYETNPRSVWGYVQGLTRLSQRTPWQDGRFALDRAASRLLTTVH